MTRTRTSRGDAERNATCRLLWQLRADSRGSSSFDVAAGLSGNTLSSESTNQAETLSRCAACAGRERKQIKQARSLRIISNLKLSARCFCEPIEVMFPFKNPLLRRRVFEQILSESSRRIRPRNAAAFLAQSSAVQL